VVFGAAVPWIGQNAASPTSAAPMIRMTGPVTHERTCEAYPSPVAMQAGATECITARDG
jgi:hypothetical protein